jgi:hypothetical protein
MAVTMIQVRLMAREDLSGTDYRINICASNRRIALGGGALAASITIPVRRPSRCENRDISKRKDTRVAHLSAADSFVYA